MRDTGWVLVRGLDVGDCLALEDTWKGSGYGVSCWMKRDVPRFGSEIGQAQSKMGKEGSSRGSKFKKAKYYQQKEKKIVA